MSAPSIEPIANPSFSLAEGFELRKLQRESQWEVDFKKNHEKVAESIAQKITEQIKKILSDSVSDPYKRLPDYVAPLSLQYTFQIAQPKLARQVWEYADESAKLSPFNEWFPKFTDENETSIDYKYFQPFISKIGFVAMTRLLNNLEVFKNTIENSSLCREIYTTDDVYSLKIWIDTSKIAQNQDDESESDEETNSGMVSEWVNWGAKLISGKSESEGYSSF